MPRRSKTNESKPRRPLLRDEAALHVFNRMVKNGRMPLPRLSAGQEVWVNTSLDIALEDDKRAAQRRDASKRKGGRRAISPTSAMQIALARKLEVDEASAAAMIAPLFTAYPLSLVSIVKGGKVIMTLAVNYSASPDVRRWFGVGPAMMTKEGLTDSEWKALAPDVKQVLIVMAAIELGAEAPAVNALNELVVQSRWRAMLQFLVDRAAAITVEDPEGSGSIAAIISLFIRCARRVLLTFAEKQSSPSTP